MKKTIVTAGTIITKWEEKYVADAVKNLSNPKKFDYYLKKFPEEFAKFIGVRYAIPTSSGTGALHLACAALGLKEGDEVIMPDLAFVAAANAISYTGAKPVFADVKMDTWCIDPESVKSLITPRTKAILPVYMYGNKPDIKALKKFGLPIIEDSCPAIGTKDVGKYSSFSCFSFQGAKTLAIGIGGMLVTNDRKLYEEAHLLLDHYQTTPDFYHEKIGFNYCMSNVQAAVGLGQLKHVKDLIKRKHQINKWYGDICSQKFSEDSTPWMNSFLTKDKKGLRKYLKENGIDTRSIYPPMSALPMYESPINPNAYAIAEGGVNIPSASYLTKKEIDYVVKCIKEYEGKSFN